MTNEQLYLAESVADFIREADWLNTRDKRTLAQFREKMVCLDSPIGDYKCAVEIKYTPQSGIESICCDTCLKDEIYDLNRKQGITTIGSCCGHGEKQAYIQVAPQYVQKMHELGYEALPETEDGQGQWCFKPNTYFLEPVNFRRLVSNPHTVIPASEIET